MRLTIWTVVIVAVAATLGWAANQALETGNVSSYLLTSGVTLIGVVVYELFTRRRS